MKYTDKNKVCLFKFLPPDFVPNDMVIVWNFFLLNSLIFTGGRMHNDVVSLNLCAFFLNST